uniref:Uncharacterized protein n=1 Tax=Anguilla anguilla TaxID=7936 RepID=A0A0E9QCA7_ANGAN
MNTNQLLNSKWPLECDVIKTVYANLWVERCIACHCMLCCNTNDCFYTVIGLLPPASLNHSLSTLGN